MLFKRMYRTLVVYLIVFPCAAIVSEDYTILPSQMTNENTYSTEGKQRSHICLGYHNHSARIEHYDPLLQLCCHGLHSRTSSDQACCKGIIIDSRKQICCGEEIIDATGDIGCCGSFKFNASHGEICCDGLLRKQPSVNTTCCGTEAIDKVTQICCQDGVYSKAHCTSCCGSHTYVHASQICCSNTTQTRVEPDDKYPEELVKGLVGGIIVVGVAASSGVGILLCFVLMKKGILSKPNRKKLANRCTRLSCYKSHELEQYRSASIDNIITLPSNCFLKEASMNVDAESVPLGLEKQRVYFFNNVSDYFVDSETQTVEIAQTNKKNVFGQPYSHRVLATESNATVNIPNSESRMTLPLSQLRKHPIDVHCCSFDNIPTIRHKMDIPDDLDLASPTVEYFLPGCDQLCDYAVVALPFIGDPSQLRVWKFQSDEGLNVVPDKIELPMKSKLNEHTDAHFVVDGNKVRIYTKSFSGFYCTISADRPVTMRAFVFGSYKKIEQPVSPRREVRLTLFIVDDIMKFLDYKQALISREDREGRVLKKEDVLSTPHTTRDTPLKARDEIRASLFYDRNLWTPVQMPCMDEAVFKDKQVTELHAVLKTSEECDRLRSAQCEPCIPTVSEWYLCQTQGGIAVESFACVLDVDVCRRESSSSDEIKKNRLVIDELKLRYGDRLPIEAEHDTRVIQEIKEYFSSNSEQLARTRQVIQERFMVSADSTEAMFAELQRKLQPAEIIEAVANALMKNGLIGDLVALQKRGCIPAHYLNYTVQQPTSVDPSDLAVQAEETDALLGACALPLLPHSDNAIQQGLVRRELRILPVSSIVLLQNGRETVEPVPVRNVRRELHSDVSTYITNGFNGIQEQASHEQTDPKYLSTIAELSLQDQSDSDGGERTP
ncbi:uncharacterized protein LOC127855770 isoform X2 [Dreissena polymorpha]|nr:uncharacterized protein LOC127855770 isoform X2 [Dreissena polymorpha]